MIHDKYPESVNGWSGKLFGRRGYYIATVGNITEDAVKEYIQQHEENREEKILEGSLFEASRYKCLRHPPFRCCRHRPLIGA